MKLTKQLMMKNIIKTRMLRLLKPCSHTLHM